MLTLPARSHAPVQFDAGMWPSCALAAYTCIDACHCLNSVIFRHVLDSKHSKESNARANSQVAGLVGTCMANMQRQHKPNHKGGEVAMIDTLQT